MRVLTAIVLAGMSLSPMLDAGQAETAGEKLTAREMFLAARDAAGKAKPNPKPRPPVATAPAPSSPNSTPQVAAAPAPSSPNPAPEARTDVIRALYSSVPLGLRYTLVKRVAGELVDVSPDSVFHGGDHIQVGVEVSEGGYLYIVSQGTSGTWEVLFPSAKIGKGDNRVQSGQRYFVPDGSTFFGFSGKPGIEKLFLIFARQPEQEMDQLIYSLQGGRRSPVAEPAEQKPAEPLLLSRLSPIDNGLVDQLRTTYSRDLIIEKLDEEKPGQKPDKSVYVVNPKNGPDTRVVADIRLVHE